MLDKLSRFFSRQTFKPYHASDEGFDHSNFVVTLKNVRKSYKEQGLVSSFENYCNFIQRLRDLSNTEIVPLKDLFNIPADDKHIISLRHDIDADPLTALRMARYNARYGICGSFYILHTAYYYGSMINGVFQRNHLLKEWMRGFIVAGCEIGLHIDPFSLYIDYGIDGASALCEELKWLREQGAMIYGTVAHNSFPAYGAENFEIFKNRVFGNRKSFQKDNIRITLGILNEKELGLHYEGNYADEIRLASSERIDRWLNSTTINAAQSENWMRTYLFENPYCQWGPDVVIWPISGYKWSVAARPLNSAPFFKWNVSQEETLSVFRQMPPGTRTSIVLHPIYFSRDKDNA
jgi:hypothetical protein